MINLELCFLILFILKVPWNEIVYCSICYMLNIQYVHPPPVRSENWSIKLTRTRGNSVGQRCVGVCVCVGDVSLQHLQRYRQLSLLLKVQTYVAWRLRYKHLPPFWPLTPPLWVGVYKINDPIVVSVQFSAFVLPGVTVRHGNVFHAETSPDI